MKTKIMALLLAAIALTSIILIATVSAMPMSQLSSKMPTQANWIKLNGIITKYNTTDARGQLFAQARTALLANADTRQFARASAVWTTNLTRPISTIRNKENFTYTFYSAQLLNASVSSSTVKSTNYFLNGTWNVATVKCNVTVITNATGEIVSVHRNSTANVAKAYGELNVTDNWTKFTLKLKGYGTLSGTVARSMMRQTMFNWAQVTDSPSTTVVTKADVNTIIQGYRAMPGWGNYDNRMDFNFNYKIDITDLATVAANL